MIEHAPGSVLRPLGVAAERPAARVADARAMRHVRIASTGLDLLHAVRLKVAASLLLADFIQAELVDGAQQEVDLLVGDADDAEAQASLHAAAAAGRRVLAISRSGSGPGGSALAQGASVRQIHQQLLYLLAVDAARPVATTRSVFDWLARHPQGACLMHNGLLRLCVDAGRKQVALLRAVPMAGFAEKLCEDGWSCEVLDPPGWDNALADAVYMCQWEALCWQAALLTPQPLPQAPQAGLLRLRGWPELDGSAVPMPWLVGLSALLRRHWQPEQLAQATGMAMGEVARIAAVAHWTGLVDAGDARGSRAVSAPMPGLLTRFARRLGLLLPLSPPGHGQT